MLDIIFSPHFFWPFKKRLLVEDLGRITYGAKTLLLTDITSIACGETQLRTYQRKANRWSTILLVSPRGRLKIHFSSIGWLHNVRDEIHGLYARIINELQDPVIRRIGDSWIQTLIDGGTISVGKMSFRKTGVQIGNRSIPWHTLNMSVASGHLEFIAFPEKKPVARLNLIRTPNAIVLHSFFPRLKNILSTFPTSSSM